MWIANHMARLSTTPTTAAVMADMAPLRTLLPRSTSTKGAPKNIHKKHGIKVTQVVNSPPKVAAVSGERHRITISSHEPDELQNHYKWPRRRFSHSEAIQHFAWFQPPILFDGTLRYLGENGVGPAERDNCHLAEEDCDLAKDILGAESG